MASAIRQRRRTKFGTSKAAYDAAGVSSATWEKAESGGSIREDRLIAIVRTLWPETEGDWTQVLAEGSVGGIGQAAHQYVSSSVSEQVEDGKQDSEVLRAIAGMSATLDQLLARSRDQSKREVERDARVDDRFASLEAGLRELSERVEQLEEPRT